MPLPRLTCPELIAFLDDFVAGALSSEIAAAFQRHLERCPACVAYTNTYRATIRLGREALRQDAGELPEGVPDQLVAAILAAREPPN